MLRFAIILPLSLVSCSDETLSGYAKGDGTYVLEELNGAAFEPRATLNLTEQGEISGEGPCNSYFGAQSAPYPWFEVKSIGSTKRACPDLRQEAKFFDALQSMSQSEVSGDILLLTNESGEEMVFRWLAE